VPLLPPRIGVARADPAVVRRARADEEATEREREMKDLHSGVAISRKWRELNQPAATGIGQAVRTRTAACFRGCPLLFRRKHEAVRAEKASYSRAAASTMKGRWQISRT
jgi:hypothetical protein